MTSGLISKSAIAITLALALLLVESVVMTPHSRAQSAKSQAPAATQPPTPQWQIAAGGKMAFEVASVKQNKSGSPPLSPIHTNIGLSAGDDYAPTGGLFSTTNWPLDTYIGFAYKIMPSERVFVERQLPKWATTDRFDIEARAAGTNPSKDQMRLMMQTLLADRFKLVVHHETRQVPVFGLVLDKPGKAAPQLQPHSDDPPCANVSGAPATVSPPQRLPNGLTPACGTLVAVPLSGRLRAGGRNLTMEQIAGFFPSLAFGGVDRPVLDRTGRAGHFDFWIEFTPQAQSPDALPPDFQPDPSGVTFLEAIREQLGLKLVPQTGPVDVLVIDHIEEPSPN